jgi:hypothetical protein
MQKMNVKEIKTNAAFSELFPIRDELFAEIAKSMQDTGYDELHPVTLAIWDGQDQPVCIDGHTRLQAAMKAGIEEVPVCRKDFQTEEEAWNYAVHLQVHRRNLTDSDLFRLMRVVDKRDERHRDPETGEFTRAQGCANGKSAGITAQKLGVSARKVEQMRTIAKYDDPDIISALESGEISINQAYTMTQEKKKSEAPATVASTKPKQKDDSGKGGKTSTVQAENSTPKQKKESQSTLPEKAEPGKKTVPVSDEHFASLAELDDHSVEEHVALAIEQYLELITEENEESAIEDPIALIAKNALARLAQQNDEQDIDEDEYDDQEEEFSDDGKADYDEDEEWFDDGEYDD